MSDVTRILNSIEQGDPKAADELLPLLYAELRRLAAQKMAREQPGHTLQATALLHEPGFAWAMESLPIDRISSPRLPRPCGEFSSTVPAVSIARSAVAEWKMSM